jgi:dsRNA-specific ribonuclease
MFSNNEKYNPLSWFKNGDFKNHILNENNISLTEKFINDIFKTYSLDYKVKNLENFQIAVTHVSYLKKSIIKDKTALLLKDIEPISDENKKNVMPLQCKDYNTFEFLGDAVIHLALTEYLYNRYPKNDQGFLTKLRTKLEKSETLSYLSKQLNLHKYVVIARNMEKNDARNNDNHLTEDIFESFICALFKESTYTNCKLFIIPLVEKEIDMAELINCDDNYKEKIMQYFNKMKWKYPKYIESGLSQKNNTDVANQLFVIYVQNHEGETLGVGTGNIKSKAEQNAAHDALVKLGVIQDVKEEHGYYGESYDTNNTENDDDNDYYDYESDNDDVSDDESVEDQTKWFKDGDFINHILNEKNIFITKKIINKIFKKYNFDHKVKDFNNYVLSTVHISYLEKTILKDKTAQLLKDVIPISDEDRTNALPLQKKDHSRLGHLGNAVMHLVLSEYLCKRYPLKDQGFLTKLRTRLERTETLSNLAKKLDFHNYAIVARNMEQNDGRNQDINLTKNIFEAFVGSIYLETNYEKCYAFLKTLIEKEVDFAQLLETDDNYKGKLMQHFHKLAWKDPVYDDIQCDPEAKEFVVGVKNPKGETLGVGSSNTKSKAAQEAAYHALIQLDAIDNEQTNDNDYYGEISDDDNEIIDSDCDCDDNSDIYSVSSTDSA